MNNSIAGFDSDLQSMNNPALSYLTNSSKYLELKSYDESAYNCETSDSSSAVIKYIQDMLMEEDLDCRTCMLQDCLALQATEKSFYDLLGENYPPTDQNVQFPGENFTPTTSFSRISNHSFVDVSTKFDSASELSEFECFLSPICGNRDVNTYSGSTYAAGSNPWKSKGRTDDCLEEGRSKKHSVVRSEESEQLEKFDESFLLKVANNESIPCPLYDASRNEESKTFQQIEQSRASLTRVRRQPNNEMLNLSTQLIYCAQAAGRGDQTTAYEQLKLIMQHSSPFGDGNQRLAHYFGKALEARLAGNGISLNNSLEGASATVADILKAYQLYVSVCPFRKMTNFFTSRTIAKVAKKAKTLHIVDFGICYGFQWPCLINHLSTRPGGSPKIRITGIDFPQSGFRPAERVEETGRRLKKLADKLNVPFEYNAIAQKWDTINLHDLKIENNETVAVCCMYRLKNLPDDTIVLNSPRDAVLNFIKSINPHIFVHGIVNGNYNAPFFISRFREALHHFSTLFDMLEAISSREDRERLLYEQEFIGNEVMNVVACEGLERYERTETYKQWQIRNSRIGFEQLPLQEEIMRRVRNIKNDYHKDFVIHEDGDWMVMGWKGRIIHAISAWKAIQD